MDYVDEENGKFCDIHSLGLDSQALRLVGKATEAFAGETIRYFRVERGLSGATKIVAKPESLFPLMLKIGPKGEIQRECDGDGLLRYRIPPLSIPPLESVHYENELGVIVYRYITGGRVRHVIRRFDTAFHQLPSYTVLQIVDDLYDVILKKCHWLDGKYEMLPLRLPDLTTPRELDGDEKWSKLLGEYDNYRRIADGTIAPHGITHGDVHAKNILITRNDAPILIDFSMAMPRSCHYIDFAKMEVNLQFQVENNSARNLWRVGTQVYSADSLIVPRSNTKLLSCVHRIRSNLWQGCVRGSLKMNSQDIDRGYRGYLLYCLGRFYSRTSNSEENRNIAYQEFLGLLGYSQ